jgi:tetratricopeptide (TPR) repeat protein
MGESRFDEARMLAARGSLSEALSALDRLLAEQPRHTGALLLRASLLLELRQGEDALAVYQGVVAGEPRAAEAWNGLARCLHALGRDAEALEAAETARGLLDEGDNFRQGAPVYLTLVWCLRELRRYREAVAAAEEGLGRWPDAILGQWASQVEEEMMEAEKEEC